MSAADDLLQFLLTDDEWRTRVVHVERLPARVAAYSDLPVHPQLARMLAARGIPRLYTHQAEGLRLFREGKHVAVATPTASGKSLVYLLGVWEKRLEGDPGHALYLSPLKALAQDQRRVVEEWSAGLPAAARLSAALYDGDTPASARARVRGSPPALLLTNPDMLHLSLLASHQSWAGFLANLRWIVLDEAHAYRGVFGSHVAGILRRLKRMAARYGASPKFVATSATLGNPEEFLRRLTGEDFTVVRDSGAPSPPRHFLLVKPRANAYTESCELLEASLKSGLKTIAFTKARKITELLAMWLGERSPELAKRVKAYRAGYLPEERRVLERALANDELRGIVSTSALELGIDIGGLDSCLLVGFPGTMLSTWQRAGRVGRGGEPALVALVGMEDALDLYFLAHPRAFFDRPPERLLLDEANPAVQGAHLVCAAAEEPLAPADEKWFGPSFPERVGSLVEEGRLFEAAGERRWFCPMKQPQRLVPIRSAGESFLIEDDHGKPLGSVDGYRAFRECHPHAIYLHGGTTFEVIRLNPDAKRVTVREADVDHYTQAMTTEETAVLAVRGERPFGPGRLAWGEVRVTSRVIGYERKLVRGGVMLSQHALTLPPQAFETQGVWWIVPSDLQRGLAPPLNLMGALHAFEHVTIALFPLFALCDRWDLGGISTPHHPDVGTAAVFVYDGVPGGVGLAAHAFTIAEELTGAVAAHLESCECEAGCPSCIHSPKCGSGNRPLDKAGAIVLAGAFAAGTGGDRRSRAAVDGFAVGFAAAEPSPSAGSPPGAGLREVADADADGPAARPSAPASSDADRAVPITRTPPEPGHTLVFDLETQKLADEVGGWDHKDLMRLSVGVVYDMELDEYRSYGETEAAALVADLAGAGLVIGFNIRSFDYEVLTAYAPRETIDRIPTLDLLEQVRAKLGRRVRLDDLARATLGKAKSGDGLEAVRLFRAGDLERLTAYCRDDVAITRDLWAYGRAHGHVLFPSVQGTLKLPATW